MMSERFRVGVKLAAPDDAKVAVTLSTDVFAIRRLIEQSSASAAADYQWPMCDFLRALREAVEKADSTVLGAALGGEPDNA